MECMATSDNVVRAGLTPKFKDVDTLLDMLDYTPKTSSENLMAPLDESADPNVRVFRPQIPDFAVQEIKVIYSQVILIFIDLKLSLALVLQL